MRQNIVNRTLAILLIIASCSIVLNAQTTSLKEDTVSARNLLIQEQKLADAGSKIEAMEMVKKAKNLYTQHSLWEEAVACVIRLSELADYFEENDPKVLYSSEALNLARQYLAEDHPLMASAYRQRAEAFSLEGEKDSSDHYFRLALPLFRQHQDWDDLGWTQIVLGVNFLNVYELDSAEFYFQETQRLLDKSVLEASDQASIQSSVFNLSGIVYQIQGDVAKAISNAESALEALFNKTNLTANDSSAISDRYQSLGAFYSKKGDYQRAYDFFIKAINSYSGSKKSPTLLFNIGETLNRQNKNAEATKYFQECLEKMYGKQDLYRIQMKALVGLGQTYKKKGDLETALNYCQKAIDLPTDYPKVEAWTLKGRILLINGDFEAAIQDLTMADQVYRQDSNYINLNPFWPAMIYFSIGNAYLKMGDADQALQYYQQALAKNHATFKESSDVTSNPDLQGVFEPLFFLDALNGKAEALATYQNDPERLEAALATYQLTIQWIDSLQMNYATEQSQLDWSSEYKPIYEKAILAAYQNYQLSKDPKYIDLAFYFSEKGKNAIQLNALLSKEGKLKGGVPDSLIQKEKDLNIDLAFYGKALRQAEIDQNEGKLALYQKYLSQTRLDLVALREQLEVQFPKYQSWKGAAKNVELSRVQSQILDSKTAFLEYFIGQEDAFVFVITQEQVTLLRLEHPQKIQDALTVFRSCLLDTESLKQDGFTSIKDYTTHAFELYELVLASALSKAPEGIQEWIVVPDGALHLLPFEALIKAEGKDAGMDFGQLPYLLYDYQFSYANSANILFMNYVQREALSANANCLAFAPPYQGSVAIAPRGTLRGLRGSNQALEGTAREVQAIAKYFKGEFELGEYANEHHFKSLASQYGILHLAMHGVVDFEDANFNHLIFTDLTIDSTEDNKLHSYEIANMELAAQLAVLSACETGIGKYVEGEGVYSLARSFMYAGVPSLLTSLWKVDDTSTGTLIPFFYKNLAGKKDIHTSIQQAKMDYLAQANLEVKHPFYWAGFIALGDTQAIQSSPNYLLFAGLGFALVLVAFGVRNYWWKPNN